MGKIFDPDQREADVQSLAIKHGGAPAGVGVLSFRMRRRDLPLRIFPHMAPRRGAASRRILSAIRV